jgi:hypothetical protein
MNLVGITQKLAIWADALQINGNVHGVGQLGELVA